MTAKPSRQHPFLNVAMHIGEAELAALVAVGEFRVVDATKVKDSCLHVVNVHGVFRDVPAELIG